MDTISKKVVAGLLSILLVIGGWAWQGLESRVLYLENRAEGNLNRIAAAERTLAIEVSDRMGQNELLLARLDAINEKLDDMKRKIDITFNDRPQVRVGQPGRRDR